MGSWIGIMGEHEKLIDLSTRKTRRMFTERAVLTSEKLSWQGIRLEERRIADPDVSNVCAMNHLLFVHLGPPRTLHWSAGGPSQTIRLHPGQISLVPHWIPHSARMQGANHFLMLSFTGAFLANACNTWADPESIHLSPVHGADDPLAREICLALHEDVRRGAPSGRIYGETLAASLAVHLSQRYGGHPVHAESDRHGLSRHKLRQAIQFIHDHLTEDFSLTTLAAAVAMSPYHFSRMFKRSTGLPPHQYVLRERVREGRRLLLSSSIPISEISLRMGFSDQSHFTRQFRRVFGMAPRRYIVHHAERKIIP